MRRRKPEKRVAQLAPRSGRDLVAWTSLTGGGSAVLLLDTNVYINRAAGRLDAALRELIDRAFLFHCSVALAELATGIANADPSRTGWPLLRDYYVALFQAIPASRLVTPEEGVWTDAGMISGMLARTRCFQPHQRKECLNDALIFLTAAKAGIPVLTANRDEFDIIQQIVPEGRFIHY